MTVTVLEMIQDGTIVPLILIVVRVVGRVRVVQHTMAAHGAQQAHNTIAARRIIGIVHMHTA